MLTPEQDRIRKRRLSELYNPELGLGEPGEKRKSKGGLAEKITISSTEEVKDGVRRMQNDSKKASKEGGSDDNLAFAGGWGQILGEVFASENESPELKESKAKMDIEQDPVTGNLEETSTFSKSSGVTVDKAYDTSFKLIEDLKSQFGMTTEQAAGFVGNLWHETGGFKFMQELKPTVKGSKGGLAFAQWTGDRRDDFESLLKELGDLPPESYEGNWAMISEEFDTTEKSALNKILNTDSLVEAAKATSDHYLRPGKPQLNKRVSAAEDIYKRYNEDRSLK